MNLESRPWNFVVGCINAIGFLLWTVHAPSAFFAPFFAVLTGVAAIGSLTIAAGFNWLRWLEGGD